ncbi:MAG: serine/threonine protein kinase [Sandaracinus sp.]|nr:serine/threonine protein kinase [Sandaracinus sp.]MCB9624107.1 serine/threonine protein kinase [Sandaracinus sp.]
MSGGGSDTFRSLSELEGDTDMDSPDGWLGRFIDGRYRIIEKLAEGGMGSVFVAEHLTLGKLVALKVIHPTLAGDSDFAERFAREAMVSAKLDHPHVASAMDYGRLPEGGAYLVLQLVRGPSVQDVLERKGALTWPRVCAIGAQVADALAAAHAEGIVHRDLKPENVLLERRDDGAEHVKVLDFGIARVDSSPDGPTTGLRNTGGSRPIATRALTRRGMVVGTPGYMAPEQALGEETDFRADLYALGVLLFESVTGRALFPQESLADIVSEQLSNNLVPRILDYAPGAPDELQALIDRLLARQPKDRPQSASEVRDILRDLTLAAAMSGDPRARLTPASGSYVVREDTAPVPNLPQLAPQKPTSKAPLLFGLLGSLVVLGGAVAFVTLTREPEVSIEELRSQVEAEHAQGELDRWINVLVDDASREQRRTAAGYVLAHEPADQAPAWARALAKLEDARGCDAIAAALTELREIAEPRTHGPIERYQRRTRARRLRRHYRCVQDDLRDTLAAIPAGATVAEDDGSGDDEPGVASDDPE